jgi:hypothetical protein
MALSGKYNVVLIESSEFAEFATVTEDMPDGVEGVLGTREDETSELQALHFDAEVFTRDQVGAWLAEKGYEAITIEEPAEPEDDPASLAQRKLHIVRGRMLKFDGMGDGPMWHMLLNEGEAVYDSWGYQIKTSAEWLQLYASAFAQYTRDGEFHPPVLYNHDCFGERCGDLLDCQYLADGPQGAGLYFQVQWLPEMKDAIEAGKWTYGSISIWEDVCDWNNEVYPYLPMEISVTNIPQVTTLPSLADGVAALNRRTAMSRHAKRQTIGGENMADTSQTSPVDAGGVSNVELSAIKTENETLRAELSAMGEQVIALRREKSRASVESDIVDGFWTVKDDTERTLFGRLVKLHMERPDDYEFFKTCSPRVERTPQRLGSRGPDNDTEVVSFSRENDMNRWYRDKAIALAAEKGIDYVEALTHVKAKYPASQVLA